MKEVRDIKLDLLMGNQNPIINLFNQITSDIKIINCDVYDKNGLEFIYYKDDQWIFFQDCKNEKFWCNYSTYWSFFKSNFNLGYQEIQAITKYLIEEALKREVNTPKEGKWPCLFRIEEALKKELSTPMWFTNNETRPIEQALKRNL